MSNAASRDAPPGRHQGSQPRHAGRSADGRDSRRQAAGSDREKCSDSRSDPSDARIDIMRIALAQLNFTIGAFERTYEQIRAAVDRARAAEADLAVFTELATTGYPPRDLLNHESFIRANLELLDRVAALTD